MSIDQFSLRNSVVTTHPIDLRNAAVSDVAPNNIAQSVRPRRNGIRTFLDDNIPEDHKATLKAIEDARNKLAELEDHRAFLERVAHAASISLDLPTSDFLNV
jgi:hypothetical protein